MVCPHRHATSRLSLVHATWIVPSRNVMDCTLDKCHILSLECHGLSLKQISLIVPGTIVIVPGTIFIVPGTNMIVYNQVS